MCRFFVTLIVIAVGATSSFAQTTSEETQELKMGDEAILTTLAAFSSSPTLALEHPAFSESANGIELGTALIAARNSAQSLQYLARLHRFVLDGAYGETFDIYLCEKGRRLETYIAKLKPEDLRNQCVREFQSAVKANPKDLGSAKVENVCASVATIRTHLKETLEMVQSPPSSCQP